MALLLVAVLSAETLTMSQVYRGLSITSVPQEIHPAGKVLDNVFTGG